MSRASLFFHFFGYRIYLTLGYVSHSSIFNPLIGTLKPQRNGPLYSNTVIGTLAVDGWAVTFGGVCRAGYGSAQSLY